MGGVGAARRADEPSRLRAESTDEPRAERRDGVAASAADTRAVPAFIAAGKPLIAATASVEAARPRGSACCRRDDASHGAADDCDGPEAPYTLYPDLAGVLVAEPATAGVGAVAEVGAVATEVVPDDVPRLRSTEPSLLRVCVPPLPTACGAGGGATVLMCTCC